MAIEKTDYEELLQDAENIIEEFSPVNPIFF